MIIWQKIALQIENEGWPWEPA